jgi:hypothetical protein
MPDEEWIRGLADGRRVKFTIQKLPDDVAEIQEETKGASAPGGRGGMGDMY